MHPLTLTDLGEHGRSLQLECAIGPIDLVVERRGLIPNGYFWESVAQYLCEQNEPALLAQTIFDPEANAFFASSPSPEPLRRLGNMVAEVVNDEAALEQLFERGEASGFIFEG